MLILLRGREISRNWAGDYKKQLLNEAEREKEEAITWIIQHIDYLGRENDSIIRAIRRFFAIAFILTAWIFLY